MSWRRWAIPRTGADAAMIALFMAASLLLSGYLAADHRTCHGSDADDCPVCWYVCALGYLPNTPPPPPVPVIERRSIRPGVLRPIIVSLIVVAPRGPPQQLV